MSCLLAMDTDAASKKRKRADGVGSSDVEVDAQAPGETAKVVAAVPTKKAFDVNALKAKMAETKRKMEEMKAAAQAGAQDQPASAAPSTSSLQSVWGSSAATSAPVAPATSSAHARYLQEQQDKRMREQRKQAKDTSKQDEKPFDPSFDPRLKRAPTERKARPLVFLQPGELTKRAEEQNTKIEKMVETKQQESDFQSKHASSGAATTRPRPSATEDTSLEWWDQPYVLQPSSGASSMAVDSSDRFDTLALKEDMITLLIHHPVMTQPAAEAPEPAPRPLMLTPEQERRLAKQKRQLAQETRKEEILLGLRPAEPNRVKLSTMVKVFSDAITDPTLVEKRVREEQALREARHLARNAERALTPEERKAKKAEKRKEDTSLSSHVAVFRILSLENGKLRFKIKSEVEKFFLSGIVAFTSDFAILVVEGGPKGIASFAKKMLKKTDWKMPLPPPRENNTANASTDAEEGTKLLFGKKIDPEDNTCHLVWQGEVLRRSFIGFRFTTPHQGARNYMSSLGVTHYYDAAKNHIANDVV